MIKLIKMPESIYEGAVVETSPCLVCDKTTTMSLPLANVMSYLSGAYVQDTFRSFDADKRELIKTGTHPACWDTLFPDDDDECTASCCAPTSPPE
jgi:hypothetical protein